jgi:alginate O-acetyltransferase complex protein AlgI
MLFNSATYVFLFMPLVTTLYWLLPKRPRMWLILIASLTFYGFWRFDFVPLIIFSAMLDYFLALWIAGTHEKGARRRIMLISVAANLIILGFFKYLNFFVDSVGSISQLIGYDPGFVGWNVILPLGISFYIFQTLSYTIDVYRRDIEPERDWLKYICFVTFFGHMVAGPILRAPILLPQFGTHATFSGTFIVEGIKRILAGLFLKVVIADTIAPMVDKGFARPAVELSGLDAWTLAFMFGFQIYFDFAGYSQIAIGSAKLLGITLPENFDFPYLSSSPRQFWQRWHISLSTWIRDYLYLPLIGTFHSAKDTAWDTVGLSEASLSGRVPPQRKRTYALFSTWIIMGLWHGASWTFAIWGVYHAILIQLQRLVTRNSAVGPSNSAAVAGFAVTLPLVMAGWVPFRCETVHDSFTMWGRMFDPRALLNTSIGLSPNTYLMAAAVTFGMIITWAWLTHVWPRLAAYQILRGTMAIAYYAVAISSVFVFLEVQAQFIYFQF